MKYPDYMFPDLDGVDPDDHVIVTYLIKVRVDKDITDELVSLAGEQSVTTWTPVAEVTEDRLKKYFAKIVSINEVPGYEFGIPEGVKERTFVCQMAFPIDNIKGDIAALLSTVAGNITALGNIKLMDLSLPKNFVADFKGPKFGIEGLRKLLDVPERPIICNMIKPDTGFPPEVGAKLFYEAARGGVDVIKDDELLMNPDYCKLEDRVAKYMEARDRAKEETGEETLFTVNVTADGNKVFENAEKAIDGGVNALMINCHTAGLGILRSLAEDPSIKVPILAHPDFTGAIYESPISGLASHLLMAKLPRLAGADMAIFPAYYGKFPYIKNRMLRCAHSCRNKFHDIKPIFPGAGGGTHPGHIPPMIDELGFDQMLPFGGGVHGHPDGSAAGGKAIRQAIEASMKGVSLEEYAEDHPELKRAIEYWGAKPEIRAVKPV